MRRLSEHYGLDVDPAARVSSTLSVGALQRVEILRALFRGADILILDEPTAVLTPQEAQGLFRVIRDLAGDGKTTIFISHKLEEVLEISQTITVLRDGRVTGVVAAAARRHAPTGPAHGRARGIPRILPARGHVSAIPCWSCVACPPPASTTSR